jgi:hypothetical protein
LLTIWWLHQVRRAGGDSIDIQRREIDDLSLWLGSREPTIWQVKSLTIRTTLARVLRISIKNALESVRKR